jgi:hypothetical protein
MIADLAGSGRDRGESVCRLWQLVERMGGEPEGAGELAHASRLFDQVHSEASRALAHRNKPWQPSDPARLAQGCQQIIEGKAVNPEEARERFRTTPE